jgi:DNA ligase-1
MLKRPLKAPSISIINEELDRLHYPVYGSPKLDGFRCVIDGVPKTNSMKPIPNKYVLSELSKPGYNGLDGELIIGLPNSPDAFNNTTGPLRRYAGKPDFYFYVFDDFSFPGDYKTRWIDRRSFCFYFPRVITLEQIVLNTPGEVITYETHCLTSGYEGIMLRTATGLYKQGRATFREMNIFKRKPFTDTEGTIIGFTEQQTNLNPAYENELGLTKRATCQENLVGAETLGNFILKSKEWESPFACGGGKLTHAERKYIWDYRNSFLKKELTFKYQNHGSINAPRSPIFLRFKEDL